MENRIPILNLNGTPYQNGKDHGEKFAATIERLIEQRFDYLIEASNQSINKKKLRDYAKKCVPYIKKYDSDFLEEVKGIADGANRPFDEVLFHNCYLDVEAFIVPKIRVKTCGCTTFAISEHETKSKRRYIGQSWDFPLHFEDGQLLLKIKPEKGPTQLVFTFVGTVGSIGFNSDELGVGINWLCSSDSQPGVPYTFIVRKILQQNRVGKAMDAILDTNVQRAGAIHYTLMDANGDIYGIETSASNHEILLDQSYTVHSNHFLSPKLQQFECAFWVSSGHSIVRLNRMKRLLRSSLGEVDITDIMNFYRDHGNYPDSICRHADENLPENQRVKTMATMIMSPSEKKAWISLNNACQSEFKEYTLEI